MTDFAFAELNRRFNGLLVIGTVSGVSGERVTAIVNTAAGDLPSPALRVIGRSSERMSPGEKCLVICPLGELAQGVIVPLNEDPLLEELRQRVASLEQQLSQLGNA